MQEYLPNENNHRVIASVAYLVIIIAGLKAAHSLIVPILIAFFWFLLFLPFIERLKKLGYKDYLVTTITFGLTLVLVALLGL
ncbi:MAG: hypothetical protein JXQ76_04235, partial [Campylobacterales bacterium]|nr:hypothetical protein [Campylobacterales bacterium]